MKVYLTKGSAWTVKNGERVSVEIVDIQEYDSCCKLDCCTKGLYMQDIATNNTMVGWFENGVWTTGTVAQFNTARAAYQ